MKYGKYVLMFQYYVESVNNIVVFDNEIENLKREINLKFDKTNVIDTKKLFKEYSRSGLVVRNGIDTHAKFYEFIFKFFMDDFIFYKSKHLISLEEIESEKKDIDDIEEEFSIDRELSKFIDEGDIKDEF